MKQFQNILVAVDLRFEDHPALQSAVRIAERNQAKLKIVDVVPEVSWLKRLAMPSGEETQELLFFLQVDLS